MHSSVAEIASREKKFLVCKAQFKIYTLRFKKLSKTYTQRPHADNTLIPPTHKADVGVAVFCFM